MWMQGLISRGAMPVLEKVLAFTQDRQQVLANNVANFDTVDYKTRDLAADEFYSSLNEAARRRNQRGAAAPLQPRSSRNIRWNDKGGFEARPKQAAAENILFHDGNNRFVEKQLSEMAQNAFQHNVAAEMLRQQYNLLQTAIRGRM